MCWTGKTTDKKVAGENLTVYKILFIMTGESKGIISFSPFYGMGYEKNKVYERSITPRVFSDYSFGCQIDEGFHCYDGDCIVKECTERPDDLVVITKDSYRHIFSGPTLLRDKGLMAAFKCVIPKGTTYYINKDGEIVSEKIEIINRIIVPKHEAEKFKDLKDF